MEVEIIEKVRHIHVNVNRLEIAHIGAEKELDHLWAVSAGGPLLLLIIAVIKQSRVTVEIQTELGQMMEIFPRGFQLASVLNAETDDLQIRESGAVFSDGGQVMSVQRTDLEEKVKPVCDVGMMVQ